MTYSWLMVLLATFCLNGRLFRGTSADNSGHYFNTWAVEIPGGLHVVRAVAETYGYRVVREFKSFPDHYLLQRTDVPHSSGRRSIHHTRRLASDKRVLYAEQQQRKSRSKRDFIDRRVARNIVERNGMLDDPQFSLQWYINQPESRTKRREIISTDLRVKSVWKRGITGKNVIVTIIDDGLERDHPDLKDNYDPLASHDFNSNDEDPTPRYDRKNENKHGTRCAGVVSMIANNKICGVGIAFDSKIGGIRSLDGNITDHSEGDSIGFNHKHIDIYSASWGPNDDGKTVEGPGRLARKALARGINEGRGGRGSLFVWASGNGGYIDDNCNADGYASAIETISVNSASQEGRVPFYSEKCSSTLTTTYSSGSYGEDKVISADIRHKCTNSHSGTSASAPMLAGILALLLEHNPNVTWRDVQHIIVHTSRMEPLASERDWYRNGAGYCVNLAFGFGLIDALAIIELGDPATWKNVGEQRSCVLTPVATSVFPYNFVSGQWVEVLLNTTGCAGEKNEINYLEHTKVIIDVAHDQRGRIYAEVESPMGTVTPLMFERSKDTSEKGFRKWPLISTHNWGERPHGVWVVRVADRKHGNYTGRLKSVKIRLYGTKEQPEYKKKSPRNCTILPPKTYIKKRALYNMKQSTVTA